MYIRICDKNFHCSCLFYIHVCIRLCLFISIVDCIQILKEKALKQNVNTSVTLSTAVTITNNGTTTTATAAATNATHTSLMSQPSTVSSALESRCKIITNIYFTYI